MSVSASHIGTARPKAGVIGTILDETWTNGLGDYTVVTPTSGTSATIVGGALLFDNINGDGNDQNYVQYNGSFWESTHTSNLEELKLTQVITFNAYATIPNISSLRFYIRSKIGFYRADVICYHDVTVGSLGLYYFLDGGAGQSLSAGPSFVPTLGQQIKYELTMSRNGWIYTATNLTTNTPYTSSYLFPTASSPIIANCVKYQISNAGGSYSINSFKIESTQYKNIEFAILGDSISKWYYASTVNNRYFELIKSGSRLPLEFGNFSAPGLKTSDALLSMYEVINVKPKYAMLLMGTNDAGQGVSVATYQANMISVYNEFIKNNINVIICHCVPNNNVDITPYNAVLNSTNFPKAFIISSTFTDLKAAVGNGLDDTYNSGDGTHLNDLGNSRISTTIRTAIPHILYI